MQNNSKNILFVTRSGWPGVVNDLKNIKLLIDSSFENVSCEFMEISNAQNVNLNVIRRVKTNPPDFMVIGGWDSVIKNIILNTSSKTTVLLKWCSPITQIELGGEMGLFAEVLQFSKTDKIDYVGFSLMSDVEVLQKNNNKIVHTPVFLDTSKLDNVQPNLSARRKGINCDIFCAPNPRKNILAQLFALASFKDEIVTHINYGMNTNGLYAAMAGNILNNLVNHGWSADRGAYLSLLKAMDFGLQVTLSEGLNYTAAEHMHMGVPIICSAALPFVRDVKELKDITIQRPEDLREIEAAIKKLTKDEGYRKEMGQICKNVFTKHNNIAKISLKDTLERIVK